MYRIALVGLIACGNAATAIEHKVPASPYDVELPASYAGLFVDGATWTFTAESMVDNAPVPLGPLPRQVTCTVTKARAISHGRIAALDCRANYFTGTDLPTETFIGTAAGLWRAGARFDGDIGTLRRDEMLLAAAPMTFRRESRAIHTAIEAMAYGGGWCISLSSWGSESTGWTLCLRARDGVFGGNAYFGSTTTYFGGAPRD